MTSITWAGPRCEQEAAAILGSQNRTQGRCVVLLMPQTWSRLLTVSAQEGRAGLRSPGPGRAGPRDGARHLPARRAHARLRGQLQVPAGRQPARAGGGAGQGEL